MADAFDALTRPARLWSGPEVCVRPSPVPAEAGVYAWFFERTPGEIDTSTCVRSGDTTLLYVGISPKAPSAIGSPSKQTLRARIRQHYRGNAEGSTLRLTLGCLLADELGVQLRRVGSGKRLTFSSGEACLTRWMDENALVCWYACPEPWLLESDLISRVDLPLNLDQNLRSPFHAWLTEIRSDARARARALPIVAHEDSPMPGA